MIGQLILALCIQELLHRRRQFTDHETHLGMLGFEVWPEAEAGKGFAADWTDGNQQSSCQGFRQLGVQSTLLRHLENVFHLDRARKDDDIGFGCYDFTDGSL
jgi:hypothetical protein